MAKTILIIEDEISLLDALRDKLTREGYVVAEAKDGEEGLAAALSRHPDLILLDILMPKMDGMAMLKELRKNQWGKNVEVILLTNLSDVENISEALNNNVTDYLIKSDWDIDEVAKKVQEKFNQ